MIDMEEQSNTVPQKGSDFGYMYSRQAVHKAWQAHSNTTLPQENQQPSANDQRLHVESVSLESVNDQPIVGFLYSLSRGVAEYWPLHLGSNIIGRGTHCDVQLKEMSVSKEHACINVKQMKSTGRLVSSIRDIGSQTGLYLNDEELDYDGHACKNLDVIIIGNSYKLLLLLVDSSEHGLAKADHFVPDLSLEKRGNEGPVTDSTHDLRNQSQLDSTVDFQID